MNHTIQTQFNATSARYDSQRRALIPCFDLFYQTAAGLAESVPNVRRVLDLGAGTGLMSAFVYERRPEAEFVLADISMQMLAKARERFHGLPNFRFIKQDLTQLEPCERLPENRFDLIISALAIHHLSGTQKQTLFRQIARLLAPHGRFINADQVLGETPEAEAAYTQAWRQHVLRHPGLSEADKTAAFERIKLDRMSKRSEQFQWLHEAGLQPALYFQHYNFVVFAADKGKAA
ncbi:class I SAM-dependent methyltransferase [Eikenella sp. S3360]|uniref:Class I SAM-dependent methyltransferase n=1 Tax=Eikenella glucosivorans TaxID=2766967 RepID=A0ABS0N8Z9_9NEIS|nr:class I SAM-dependent methyltransferase [Eikenella glucosivorans]MBH5328782.1 class I SAM-dependent methyltransferase [Eikenella glucosivorans]